jgi:cytidylate kinase
MTADRNLIQGFIKEQGQKWENMRGHLKKAGKMHLPVITICMEAGSGGSLVAQGVADKMGFDLFHKEIIQAIAESGHLDPAVLAEMEKERLSGVQDFISSLLNDRYLWPGVYLDHLSEVVHAVEKRGGAVIVGRGAMFILPPERILSIRIVAPLEERIRNVARAHQVAEEVARRRILNRDSRREAFVKKSFHANLTDVLHYNLVVNTGRATIEEAVEAVCAFWCRRFLTPPSIAAGRVSDARRE